MAVVESRTAELAKGMTETATPLVIVIDLSPPVTPTWRRPSRETVFSSLKFDTGKHTVTMQLNPLEAIHRNVCTSPSPTIREDPPHQFISELTN